MPVELPRGLSFSVDTWTRSSMEKRHHFLTHAHRDHSVGIATHCSFPIYCTHLTKVLLRRQFRQLDDSLFVCLEVGQTAVVEDPDGDFSVTVFDANHCAGAVMFLFEGNFGNILHTGDSRLTPECLRNLPEKYRGKHGKEPKCQLNFLFLDCTFGKCYQDFPSMHSATRQVINCIWNHPDAPVVYLNCNLLGQEEILRQVSSTFGSKIFVDASKNPECFQVLSITVPEVLSEDSSSRFHFLYGFGFPIIGVKTMLKDPQSKLLPKPLIIRPSTQWYVHEEGFKDVGRNRKQIISEAIKDASGVWHVCYSMHSSKDELEWALQVLAPKWVVSTTPNCCALELDYVKKHPASSKLVSDDPLWKLLGVDSETSNETGCDEDFDCSLMAEEPTQQEIYNSASSKPPIVLFRQARHYAADANVVHEEKISKDAQDACKSVDLYTHKENKDGQHGESLGDERVSGIVRARCNKMAEKEGVVHQDTFCFSMGSSNGFNGRFRELYRSMNVPVPKPLPSLVQLMKSRKTNKRRFGF